MHKDNSTKRCPACKNTFPRTLEFFYSHKGKNKDGLTTYCKECAKARKYKWDKDNPDKRAVQQKRYSDNHKPQRNIISTRWQKAYPEKHNASTARWRRDNPEQQKQIQDDWKARNPDKVKAKDHRRRARKKQAEGRFTAGDITKLLANQKGMCWWCGEYCADKYHIDHRIPLARGGTNWPSNLVIACPNCNLSKNAKLPHEWSDRLL